jgi:hypothetical protein
MKRHHDTRLSSGQEVSEYFPASVEFHRALKHRWAAKGVYRFKTHEEADQWMMKMLARADQGKI